MARAFLLLCLSVTWLGLNVVSHAAQDVVVVSKRTIYPGQSIAAHDLTSVVVHNGVKVRYQVVRDFEELVGLVASRTILPGRYIPADAARTAYLVKAGKPTRVVLRSGALSISLIGIPLANASSGDTVRMRNSSSGKVFSALVLEDGSVVAGGI